MLKDPVIVAGLEQRVNAALLDFEIVPASRDEKDLEVAAMVEDNLRNGMSRGFMGAFRSFAMAAHINGWSFAEPIYKNKVANIRGKDEIWVYLDNFKVKDTSKFRMGLDLFKNVKSIFYKETNPFILVEEEFPSIDLEKIFIFSHNMQYEDPHGRSALRRVFRSYYIKDNIENWLAMYMEKHGSPFKIARYDESAASDDVVNELIAAIRKWHNDDGAVLPPGCSIELLEPHAQGDVAQLFEMVLEHHNREITIGLTGGELTILSGDSRAEGEVHERGFDIIKKVVRDEASSIANHQIIKRLVDLNFNVSKYPKIRFMDPGRQAGRAKLAGGIIEARKLFDIGEDWAREILHIPEPKKGEKLLPEAKETPQDMMQREPEDNKGRRDLEEGRDIRNDQTKKSSS
jgi:hypothetical protein